MVLFCFEVGDRQKFPDVRIVLTEAKRTLAFESIDTYMEIYPQPNPTLARLANIVAYGSKLQPPKLGPNVSSSAWETGTTVFDVGARPARLG